jgi:hypothetical protein
MLSSQKEKKETVRRRVPVAEAVGMVLAHDITEVRSREFKGVAYKKGHIVSPADIEPLLRLGKDNLYVLDISDDDLHEDDAALALALAEAVSGKGIELGGMPKEGKIRLIASRDGLLKVNREALLEFNMAGDIMCATLHDNTYVKKGQEIGGIRAIPLVVKRSIIDAAVVSALRSGGLMSVRAMRKPKAGVVITGNEVYYGRIKDAFAPVIDRKIRDVGGEIVGTYYAPDDVAQISVCLRELLDEGVDLLVVTGGMSVDPDDVTRHAIREIGASDITYGSATMPGAMFLVAYIEKGGIQDGANVSERIPVIGVPACGMYYRTTVLDLILPRILAGEEIGRKELAELGHGGLCLKCEECIYPRCPFGK